MNVSSSSAATSSGSSGALTQLGGSQQSMDKQDFLKLLVTQLNNQDPLNPMKGQKFAAQLAQFSSLEQLININESLQGQQSAGGVAARQASQGIAADLLGKQVEAKGNAVSWDGETPAPLRFSLPSQLAEGKLTIRDAAGAPVYTEKLSQADGGSQEITWNGMTSNGEPAPRGDYTFEVSGTDADGQSVQATTFLSGRVDRVTFGHQGPVLHIGDRRVPLSSVRSIATP